MAMTAGRSRWLLRGAAAQITAFQSLQIRKFHHLNPNLSLHNSSAPRLTSQFFDLKRFATSAMPSIDNDKKDCISSTKKGHFGENLETLKSLVSGKVSKVLDVIKLDLPEVKVSYEWHFDKDFKMDKETWEQMKRKHEKDVGIKYIPEEIESVKLLMDYINKTEKLQSSNPTVDQINSTASLVVDILDGVIKHRSNLYKNLKLRLYYKAFRLTSHLIEHYTSLDDKLRVFSAVFDRIQNYPQFGSSLVYRGRILIRTMSKDDGKDDISKDEVISRVLEVVKNHPKILDSVETGFSNTSL